MWVLGPPDAFSALKWLSWLYFRNNLNKYRALKNEVSLLALRTFKKKRKYVLCLSTGLKLKLEELECLIASWLSSPQDLLYQQW